MFIELQPTSHTQPENHPIPTILHQSRSANYARPPPIHPMRPFLLFSIALMISGSSLLPISKVDLKLYTVVYAVVNRSTSIKPKKFKVPVQPENEAKSESETHNSSKQSTTESEMLQPREQSETQPEKSLASLEADGLLNEIMHAGCRVSGVSLGYLLSRSALSNE